MFNFKFDWDTRLELGLTAIDKQHQQLFKIGRQIEQILLRQCIGTNDQQLLKILYELRDYITYHFYEEEAFMKEINFPEYPSHCKSHQELQTYINKIDYTSLCTNPNQTLLAIKDHIVSWIFLHMVQEDQKISTFYHTLSNASEKE